MEDKSLRIKIISEEIKSQESALLSEKKSSAEYAQKMAESQVRRSIIEQTIRHYKADLEAIGGDYKPQASATTLAQFSANSTFELLKDNDSPNGLQIKDLIEIYGTLGISTHGRKVYRHLEDLMVQDRVFQTNPDAQRGRRYRITEYERPE